MGSKTTGNWETQYSDRFAYKRVRKVDQRSNDSIKVKRPQGIENARDEWEVIGRIGDHIHHTSHASEDKAMERVALLENVVSFIPGDFE